ncbi:hypothetical protein [Streptomyces sp. NPDC052114]|uniref:hypothetical protein n=1 Tax=unclassified Streptomyces TaxID=2593676 RepID=UPI00343C4EE3
MSTRAQSPTVTVGQKYSRRVPDPARIVTVTQVWTAHDGHENVAYEWRDDKPGLCGSACPLDVFLREYRLDEQRSAVGELAALVRACPVEWLDATYGADAEPGDIAVGLYEAVRAEQAGEKSSRAAANATPDPVRERRLEQLLDAVRTWRGRWTTVRAQDLYRLTGGPTERHVARRDLAELHRRGHLRKHSSDGGQHYTLATRKDGRS